MVSEFIGREGFDEIGTLVCNKGLVNKIRNKGREAGQQHPQNSSIIY